MTLEKLGLTEDDLDIKIVQSSSKISVIINYSVTISTFIDTMMDLRMSLNLDIADYLKHEAIDYFVNDIKNIRKLKLKKIKEKYEIKNLC